MNETKCNKNKIRKSMMEMVYFQVLSQLNTEFPALPEMFDDNKHKWSMLLLKSKPFQECFAEFTARVASLVEREVHKNRQQLSMYLTHPRVYKESLTKLGGKAKTSMPVQEIGGFDKLVKGQERFDKKRQS